jgi:osmotically-inducible protein OsmY
MPADPERTAGAPPPGSDAWVEARLIIAYSINKDLSAFDIGVDVEGDTVTLSGTVDSPVQRDLAARLARRVGSNTRVDNRLEVATPHAPAPRSNPFYRFVEHAGPGTQVKLQLLWQRLIDGLRISVMPRGDTIVLFGEVQSEAARQLAERVARRTVGIGDVENLLHVAPDAADGEQAVDIGATGTGEPVSDDWITTRVTASLRLDRAVDADGIHVSADDGILSLSGTVPTSAQKREASAVAAAIDGVRRVEIHLVVDESE